MSEFDKWFSADGTLIPKPGDVGYEGYVERREAFRAALEWVKKNIFEHEDILNLVEKELEDEKI